MSTVERVADVRCTVGESPLWHPEQSVCYWVDIPAGDLYRYEPATGGHEHLRSIDRSLGGLTIEADGSLLLFEGGGAIERWRAGSGIVETVRQNLPGETDSRFNDVATDPRGRVLAGTMTTADRLGRLYRIDRDGTAAIVDRGLDIPNGMGFSGDGSTLYLAVSDDRVIYAYEYDENTGDLSNRRTFVDTSEEAGVPDGLTVDAADHVWCARWDDHAIDRYAPDGSHVDRLTVPPPKASSLTFGGPVSDDLYVTTAVGEGATADDHAGAGSLYRIRADVAGRSVHRSRLGAGVGE